MYNVISLIKVFVISRVIREIRVYRFCDVSLRSTQNDGRFVVNYDGHFRYVLKAHLYSEFNMIYLSLVDTTAENALDALVKPYDAHEQV